MSNVDHREDTFEMVEKHEMLMSVVPNPIYVVVDFNPTCVRGHAFVCRNGLNLSSFVSSILNEEMLSTDWRCDTRERTLVKVQNGMCVRDSKIIGHFYTLMHESDAFKVFLTRAEGALSIYLMFFDHECGEGYVSIGEIHITYAKLSCNVCELYLKSISESFPDGVRVEKANIRTPLDILFDIKTERRPCLLRAAFVDMSM